MWTHIILPEISRSDEFPWLETHDVYIAGKNGQEFYLDWLTAYDCGQLSVLDVSLSVRLRESTAVVALYVLLLEK